MNNKLFSKPPIHIQLRDAVLHNSHDLVKQILSEVRNDPIAIKQLLQATFESDLTALDLATQCPRPFKILNILVHHIRVAFADQRDIINPLFAKAMQHAVSNRHYDAVEHMHEVYKIPLDLPNHLPKQRF